MIEIFYFDNNYFDINHNRHKFTMTLNLIFSIAGSHEYLKTYCKDLITDINELFRKK